MLSGVCLIAASFASDAAAVAPDPQTDRGWYVHLGAGALLFNEGAVIRSGASVIPKASVSIAANETFIAEAGYRWRHWGLSATGGFPPVATVDGVGSLQPLGSLGRIRYGPVVISGHYHFGGLGRLKPYIGAGPVFLLIFKNKDDAVRQLDVHDSVGVAVQGGTEFAVSPRWGVFVDVKKAHLRTRATALLGAAPIEARIRLDPLVLSGGISHGF
ncbi:OmpW/AlkL family protein [Sphingomonas nostoxanthinifaciens]|uniref:OmpW/AlkL family protein n=1 Tax=Sphingomonas nostoxanthinifaciens TaxID=2872652 RepID=UPI001CC1C555|nr:OmpW family outer membrane protein [Sphingomonas nostoxanthinifaciens]UAK26281.1 hypothetical protein K8P63_09425 [Sphingomonas nostoxanthinifaciens]